MLDEFEVFTYHGEFGLAWDTLTLLAQRTPPDPACWPLLADAALRMSDADLPDDSFMRWVGRAVADLPGLRAAILALPQRITDPAMQADAQRWIQQATRPE
jgi:hypothetical protein